MPHRQLGRLVSLSVFPTCRVHNPSSFFHPLPARKSRVRTEQYGFLLDCSPTRPHLPCRLAKTLLPFILLKQDKERFGVFSNLLAKNTKARVSCCACVLAPVCGHPRWRLGSCLAPPARIASSLPPLSTAGISLCFKVKEGQPFIGWAVQRHLLKHALLAIVRVAAS